MKQYIVDAFTDRLFSGNPAAVCLPEQPLSDELMLSIARENNLSETAFALREGGAYHLRWFTPGGEIDLCGHATLATAYILMNFVDPDMKRVSFETLSGSLTVERQGDLYQMNFPAYSLSPVEISHQIVEAVGRDQRKLIWGVICCAFLIVKKR